LDIDSAEEQALFDDLVTLGMQGVPAPSCASQHGNPYFRSSHEKVIVIDEEWVLVQSGNYSANSCPLNVKDGGDAAHFVPGNRDSGLAVRIVLGKLFNASELAREREMLQHLEQACGLKLGRNVRYVNTQRLVNCHNKMVLVDGSGVLVSSQNWSKAAVWENREAGLYLRHPGVCGYFTGIFETDW